MNDLTMIGAIVGPAATIGATVIGLVYRMGKKLGGVESELKSLNREIKDCNKQTSKVNEELGDIRERLAKMEGKMEIDPGEEQ